MYYVPDRAKCLHFHIEPSQYTYEAGNIPILQIRKLRLREIKQYAEGHTANKHGSQDSSSGLSDSTMPLPVPLSLTQSIPQCNPIPSLPPPPQHTQAQVSWPSSACSVHPPPKKLGHSPTCGGFWPRPWSSLTDTLCR